MSSAWLLPEHIADVLPAEARQIEELRRHWLDLAQSYGFELVMPPLLEYLESLLSGTGHELDLKTFKLIDQLSGRSLGLRADSTPQVARIDAHLLNRQGVTRLCYCGPVLHTRPDGQRATREPLQWGAEIYGHAGLEAELEVLELALDGLSGSGVQRLTLDLGDARISRSLLQQAELDLPAQAELLAALGSKDRGSVAHITRHCSSSLRQAFLTLLELYGDPVVLDEAVRLLPALPPLQKALQDLRWLAGHLQQLSHDLQLGFDLADVGGQTYYSGSCFALYGQGSPDALARGGRYDEIGAVFGRNRPAVGFSMDLKGLTGVLSPAAPRTAIRAPWTEDRSLRALIRQLRQAGETVVCILPGHEDETHEFTCNRQLVLTPNGWQVQALSIS